jgi:hypothetical protein
MAKAVKPCITIVGLTLEQAIERTVRPLGTLYEAAGALRDLQPPYRTQPRARLNLGEWPPDAERQLSARIAFVREERATFPPFLELLSVGALVIAVRPLATLGAQLQPLRPDETSQLSIAVHPLKNSLVLYGPHTEELYAVVWSAEAAPQCFDDLQIKQLPSRPATTKPAELVPQTVTIRSNKDWLEWAVRNVSPDDRKHGWKKRYATKLLAKMKTDAKSNKKIKPPQQYTSIAARLNEYSLWPETDDEKTTK